MGEGSRFVRLADGVSLRLLEEPCLYDRRRDELYELNGEGFEALRRCDGSARLSEVALEPEFLRTCLDEELLELSPEPAPRRLPLGGPSPTPSLRYLELQLTWRCNLACRHCYLGSARPVDLPVERIEALLGEFETIGGLRVLVSGGEPLLHPEWARVNELLGGVAVRRVLLTNGLRLDEAVLSALHCEEVQVSLDGLREGHEALRGRGTFEPALEAARRVRAAGLDLSVATMAHAGNLSEFEDLSRLVQELSATAWGIDAPCASGRLSPDSPLVVSPDEAARAMAHAFGGSYHGGSAGMACGLHLCTVAADGTVAPCGFYLDRPLGRAEEGLARCWSRRTPLALSRIAGCAICDAAEECGGGCRYRAPSPDLPDPVMCAAFRVAASTTL